MVIRAELLGIVKEFNKSHGGKAKLVESRMKKVKVAFSAVNDKGMEDFRELLKQRTGRDFVVKESVKSGTALVVTYIMGEEGPADKILEILKEYEEGTPPRTEEFED